MRTDCVECFRDILQECILLRSFPQFYFYIKSLLKKKTADRYPFK